MKLTLFFPMVAVFLYALPHSSIAQERPLYCDEIPVMYDKSVPPPPALPRFETAPMVEYKVQVAILKFTHPKDYPFHSSLIARYRPCEQVWVVESKETFRDRSKAEALRKNLIDMGYSGAYLIDMIGWE